MHTCILKGSDYVAEWNGAFNVKFSKYLKAVIQFRVSRAVVYYIITSFFNYLPSFRVNVKAFKVKVLVGEKLNVGNKEIRDMIFFR